MLFDFLRYAAACRFADALPPCRRHATTITLFSPPFDYFRRLRRVAAMPDALPLFY